jgi:2,3-bisphosphoglycerate-dependent phosphoglycerate mutase
VSRSYGTMHAECHDDHQVIGMSVVWFIRHGESQANAGGRTSHPARIELTAGGWEQASCIASAFVAPPALIVISPYVRAKQTALPTIRRFADIAQEEWPVHEFTYLAPFRYASTTRAERLPVVNEYWSRKDVNYVDGEGAESFADFMKRVDNALDRLRECKASPVAVFSHGQFIRALMWKLLNGPKVITGQEMAQFRQFLDEFRLPNGAIVKMSFAGGAVEWMSPVLTSHLPFF